jgi:hypothetical protein
LELRSRLALAANAARHLKAAQLPSLDDRAFECHRDAAVCAASRDKRVFKRCEQPSIIVGVQRKQDAVRAHGCHIGREGHCDRPHFVSAQREYIGLDAHSSRRILDDERTIYRVLGIVSDT